MPVPVSFVRFALVPGTGHTLSTAGRPLLIRLPSRASLDPEKKHGPTRFSSSDRNGCFAKLAMEFLRRWVRGGAQGYEGRLVGVSGLGSVACCSLHLHAPVDRTRGPKSACQDQGHTADRRHVLVIPFFRFVRFLLQKEPLPPGHLPSLQLVGPSFHRKINLTESVHSSPASLLRVIPSPHDPKPSFGPG